MVFRRKTQRKRTIRRKRMVIARRLNPATGMMQRRRILTPMVHSFKRMSSVATITGNVAYAPYLNCFSAGQIQLNNVINASDFANLYDQYRINFVVVKFYFKIDPSAQTASTASYPRLFWYRDYDDTNFPSSVNEIRENVKCRQAVLLPNRPVTIKFKPNTLQLLYQSAVANQYKPVFGQWLDMSTTTTGHFGFKYAIDDLTNTNYKVDIETTYYFQCRQPR